MSSKKKGYQKLKVNRLIIKDKSGIKKGLSVLTGGCSYSERDKTLICNEPNFKLENLKTEK